MNESKERRERKGDDVNEWKEGGKMSEVKEVGEKMSDVKRVERSEGRKRDVKKNGVGLKRSEKMSDVDEIVCLMSERMS